MSEMNLGGVEFPVVPSSVELSSPDLSISNVILVGDAVGDAVGVIFSAVGIVSAVGITSSDWMSLLGSGSSVKVVFPPIIDW